MDIEGATLTVSRSRTRYWDLVASDYFHNLVRGGPKRTKAVVGAET